MGRARRRRHRQPGKSRCGWSRSVSYLPQPNRLSRELAAAGDDDRHDDNPQRARQIDEPGQEGRPRHRGQEYGRRADDETRVRETIPLPRLGNFGRPILQRMPERRHRRLIPQCLLRITRVQQMLLPWSYGARCRVWGSSAQQAIPYSIATMVIVLACGISHDAPDVTRHQAAGRRAGLSTRG